MAKATRKPKATTVEDTPDATRQEKIRQALEALRKRHGKITPRLIVDAARSESHPLHDEFEWDDELAADQSRLDRARTLIRYITVMVVSQDRRVVVPMYVHDQNQGTSEQGYVALTSDQMDRRAAEATMLAELQRCESAINRARGVAGILGKKYPELPDQLERMLAEIVRLRTRLDEAA